MFKEHKLRQCILESLVPLYLVEGFSYYFRDAFTIVLKASEMVLEGPYKTQSLRFFSAVLHFEYHCTNLGRDSLAPD